MRVFRLVSRHGTKIIASAALVGLAFPDLAAALRPRIGDFVMVMLCVSMLRVDFAAFVGRIARPGRPLAAAAYMCVIVPAAVLGILAAVGGPLGEPAALAAIFLFVAPSPIVSAPAFAMLMGLDGALVFAVMLSATVAMPLTVPALAALFVAEALPIGVGDLAARLAVMIGGAVLAAALIRRLVGPARIVAARPVLDTLSVAVAAMFAIGAMDGIAVRLAEDTAFTLLAAAAAFGGMFLQIALTFALFRPVVGVDAVAIAYAAGNRNAGLIVAALGVGKVSDLVWLFFGLSQLPVFLFPLILTPLGRRLTRPPLAPDGTGA